MNYQDDEDDDESVSTDGSFVIVDYNISDVSETDEEYSSDSEMEEFDLEDDYEDIYQDDSLHMYSEKEHGKNYIGICKKSRRNDIIIMANSVSARTYFKYPHERMVQYLREYSILYTEQPKIHIMKLIVLEDDTYSVLIKTFWLKLVQRHWKKTFKLRKTVINKRISLYSQRVREITGKYPGGMKNLPSLWGIMSQYK